MMYYCRESWLWPFNTEMHMTKLSVYWDVCRDIPGSHWSPAEIVSKLLACLQHSRKDNAPLHQIDVDVPPKS